MVGPEDVSLEPSYVDVRLTVRLLLLPSLSHFSAISSSAYPFELEMFVAEKSGVSLGSST